MKPSYKTLAITFGALALTLLFVPDSTAQCLGWDPSKASHGNGRSQPSQAITGQAHLLQAGFVTVCDFQSAEGAIVGFWHVKFVSEGSKGIPDGTEVDAGYSQWHSDGTEIMNSGGHSPITSNFCLGVWEQVGVSKYKLNHFATAWDPTGSTLIGPANIKEVVTLDSTGNNFSGTFAITQYNEAGKRLAHVKGTITGTRITVDTTEESIF
jgi:hypothetical protein